jgi:hypothetical protein
MKRLSTQELYSQQNDGWKNTLLGYNTDKQYTIGNYGCLITCVSVYLCAIGYKVNPYELNNILKEIGGYVNGGLFIFDSLKKRWPDVVMDYVSPVWDGPVSDEGMNKLISLIDSGKPCFTEVDFYPNTTMLDQHWVLLIGYDDNKVPIMFDPWTGTIASLNVYGDARRAIYCFRTYNKPIAIQENMISIPQKEYDGLKQQINEKNSVIERLTVQLADKDKECEVKLLGYKTELKNRIIELI